MNKNIFSLKGKVIVVTGASGLLGREHCDAIASHGGIPILIDLNQSVLNAQIEQIKKKYDIDARGYTVNITDEEEIKKKCEIIVNDFGKIDGLVNNAANNPKVEVNNNEKNFSRLENFDLKLWNNDIAVGLTGAFLCSKYFGFEISKNPNGGTIINISSDLGLISPDQRLYKEEGVPEDQQNVKPITYSVIKSGLIGLTRYLSTYWADKNVRCNAICPGGVFNNQNEEFLNKLNQLIPLGRMADHDEYKGIIVFLASEASSYMNGSIISIDGGRTSW